MSDQSKKTALVTGAYSGIGFETAAQLAQAGYRKVYVGARSEEKAHAAVAALKERIGRDVFAPLVMDLSELDSIQVAVDSLKTDEGVIDSLVMGAGVMFPRLTRNSAGLDMTYGVNLVGHHALVMRLLAANKLDGNARLIFMGSEASRGDLRGIKPMDFALSEGSFEDTFEAVIRGDQPQEYKMMTRYATDKLFAVWWAAALSRRLPLGMTINVVSPGGTKGTNFMQNQPWLMRKLAPLLSGAMGVPMHSVAVGSKRMLDATEYPAEQSGLFYASPPKTTVGKVQIQENGHFKDQASQEAIWKVLVKLGGDLDVP